MAFKIASIFRENHPQGRFGKIFRLFLGSGGTFSMALLLAPFLVQRVEGFPLKMTPGHGVEDMEIRDLLQSIAQPIMQKIPALRQTEFYILANDQFNAFAIEHGSLFHPSLLDAPCVFLHTGVIEREDLGALVLVLFHELGHLAGKHMSHIKTAMSENFSHSLVPAALGCLVGGLTGSVLPAVLGLQMSQLRSFLSQLRYTRAHESAADAFAFKHMAALHWPIADGLKMMERHAKKEDLNYKNQYLLTHPFFTDRARAIPHYFKKEGEFPQDLRQKFERVKIKVVAFSAPLAKVDSLIEQTPVAEKNKNYGRAIAAYRQGKTPQALHLLSLFEGENLGADAYTCELRAQILLTQGRTQEALGAINQALGLSPKNIHLLLQKSFVLLSLPQGAPEVVALLEPWVSRYGHWDALWHWLGKAYAQVGNRGRMEICLAERYALLQKWSQAEYHLSLGQKLLSPQDPYRQRGQDLRHHMKESKR